MTVSRFFIQTTALDGIVASDINLLSDSFYAILLTGDYVPADQHSIFVDVSAFELTPSASYQRAALQGLSKQRKGKRVHWYSEDINFGSNVTLSAKYMLILKGYAVSPQAGDLIVGWQDLNEYGKDIQGISAAAPGIVSSLNHGLVDTDKVAIMFTDMELVSRTYQTVANATAASFTIQDTTSAGLPGSSGRLVKLNDDAEMDVTSAPMIVRTPVDGWFSMG